VVLLGARGLWIRIRDMCFSEGREGEKGGGRLCVPQSIKRNASDGTSKQLSDAGQAAAPTWLNASAASSSSSHDATKLIRPRELRSQLATAWFDGI